MPFFNFLMMARSKASVHDKLMEITNSSRANACVQYAYPTKEILFNKQKTIWWDL